MREMPHGHLLLDLDVGQPWTLVVHFEREDAVLVGGRKGGAVGGGVLGDGVEGGGGREDGREAEAVEGGEHGELELQVVAGWEVEAGVVRAVPEGDGDGEGHVVFDAVDVGVQEAELGGVGGWLFGVGDEVVGYVLDFEDTDFFEYPFCELFGEVAVDGLAALPVEGLDGGAEPFVL